MLARRPTIARSGAVRCPGLPRFAISPDEMNESLRTLVVAPMTTQGQAYPWRVRVTFQERDGRIALEGHALEVLEAERRSRGGAFLGEGTGGSEEPAHDHHHQRDAQRRSRHRGSLTVDSIMGVVRYRLKALRGGVLGQVASQTRHEGARDARRTPCTLSVAGDRVTKYGDAN